MSKKDKTTKPFFVTTMGDMGGNRGETEENEILWDLDRDTEPKAPKSESK
jgi:hypothetical protein